MKPISRSSCNSKISMLSMPQLGCALVMLLSLASLATSCTEQEKGSLLQFVAELCHDSGLTGSWENEEDCCKWEGITCNSNRTVTDVFLASRSLQGHISASLRNLTGLLRLNLSHNLLSGGLPMELVSSNTIIVLDVSFNQLDGDLQELQSSTLLPLQVLNISSNLFTGRFPSTIWEVMENLVALNASNNSFTGQLPTNLCVSAPFFAVLHLSYNQFNGSIPAGLGNCSMLTSLNAGNNNLSGTLPDELFNLTLLEHLSFPNNHLEGSLGGISKLTHLATLDLGGNNLSGNIPDSIDELKRLEELHLDHNSMVGELPSTLSNCTNLIIIDLKSNSFSGELTNVNFSNLPNLKTLDLLRNDFNGTIPESIYSCSNLTALRLSSNKFHGQLSERIGNLKSLTFLSLVNNSLSNITGALQILGSCRNLTTLLIGHNFFDEAMPGDDSIDGFENLRVLAINVCSLSGKIPFWLSKLINLEVLLLYGNQLTGSIPDWINSLNFLFHINISNNSLIGEIPTALMGMPMLKTDKVAPKAFELPVYKSQARQYRMIISFSTMLNLGLNNLTGVIPEEIGQLKALISLNLNSNKFTGAIPQSISNLTNLEVLDLSGNHLTGEIPTALNNLHFLSKFNISNNDLEGPIPITGQLSTFPSSSFDGNPKLCGPVLAHHCGSAEAIFSIKQTDETVEKVIFVITFGAFFGVGVLYDQIVLSRIFG
ncbi:receptor-like protein 3 [Phragmites australis]|uniref:receptor-like protein 3 n=1 Tax=Phragmites australis TaxID=29695 RepID=UPI002D7A2544|nr:receptor-like protein 3 [Phragmites australis]